MQTFDVSTYIGIASRRRWWIIAPFLVALLAGLTYALVAPKVYEAQTLILVQEQRVPRDFVQPIVTSDIEDRLRTISQQVTSRTNLETTIREYKVFPDADMVMEDKVMAMRKRITLDVVKGGRGSGGNAFSISYRDSDAKRAMDVTNSLASNFISENLKIRESQALGTSDFLTDELENVRKRLAEKEEQLKQYRERFMGAMPEHLQTNLMVQTRLQTELERLNVSLSDAENRKLIIQQQISQTKAMQGQMSQLGAGGSLVELDPGQGLVGESEELAQLKKQLKVLEIKYTQDHPDVRRVKTMIANLEEAQKEAEGEPVKQEPEAAPVAPALPMAADFLTPQLEQINMEIKSIRADIAKVQEKMAAYQRKVEETPQREQELISLSRDYDNLKKLYDSLLNRKLEAEIAVSMEKKQKGEQFRIIDPAKMPERPVEPDARKIILIAFVLGLGLGGGLAYMAEMMDTSFKAPDAVEKELSLPVLVSMPIRYTQGELQALKKKKIIGYASVSLGFVLSAFAIVIATKGIDGTVRFIKETLGLL